MRWLARGEQEMPVGDAWLAPAERARLAGLRFTKRRTEYRLRRWAGKHAVAAVAGLEASAERLATIEILNHRGGAPYVQLDGEPLDVDISLTDRAGWAVCLVSDRAGAGDGPATVGVDLELVEPRSDGFVQDFFTADESAHVRSLPAGQARYVAANLFWSAKESALKILRTGLRADTRSVEVRLTEPGELLRTDGWSPLEVREPSGRCFPGWWRRDGVFVLTVAYDRPGEPPGVLAGATADLSTAVPVHSWLTQPITC
ncbi:MAG TPA: 4'-phosphopantetheinyl transferase superfamily protein [Kineosporiaceae bacterium]